MKVFYFAWLREKIGRSMEEVSPPETVKTVAELLAWLKAKEPRYAAAFDDLTAIRAAIDQEQVDLTTPLNRAQEVAFFPPVTGG